MITTPIRKKEEIEQLKKFFLSKGEYRDYTMFVVGINTALRISDLLNLKWSDVYSFEKEQYYFHIYLTEKKTGKKNCIALNANCITALNLLKIHENVIAGATYIFHGRECLYKPISRNRAYHIIKNAATENRIDGNISCHSLRKTFGYHAWRLGTPPALIMNIYNHSNIEITKRYLCIDQDDKDNLFCNINL